jgi:DNA modification methylase
VVTAIIMQGDARDLPFPDESVDLVVTSPPYFGQRDYRDGSQSLAGQIGAEDTPRQYLAALLGCTREWARVLKPEGSLFVNLGDKYSQRVAARRSSHQDGLFPGRPELLKDWKRDRAAGLARMPNQNVIDDDGHWVAEKSLMGLPWRYAIACMDDLGLILRRDNIWSKNGLPESVTDRCQTAHEYLFHLTRNPQYYSACDEIRVPHTMKPQRRPAGHKARPALGVLPAQTHSTSQRDEPGVDGHPLGKIPGSVWSITTDPLFVPEQVAHAACCDGAARPGCEEGLAHHAAFPFDLPRRAILGWSPAGICTACGEGRRPVTESQRVALRQNDLPGRARLNTDRVHGMDRRAGTHVLSRSRITGYTCACPEPSAPVSRAVVLDPFSGTGTTALVASVLGRIGIGIDKSAGYCRLATWRTTDPGERARAMQVPKPPPVPDGQGDLFSEASA